LDNNTRELSHYIEAKEEEIQEFYRMKNGFLETLSDFSITSKQTQEQLLENQGNIIFSKDFEEQQSFENEQFFLQDIVRKTQLVESDLEEEGQKYSFNLQRELEDLESFKQKVKVNER
jgi:hypothetical protein